MRTAIERADHPRTTPHEAMISDLLRQYPQARTTGFMKELELCGDYMADILKNDPEWKAGVRIVPDAFIVDHDRGHVVVFEVVDTHDVSDHKVACINEIGWALDQDCYSIGLIRVDRHGRTLIDPIEAEITRLSSPSIESEIERLGGGR